MGLLLRHPGEKGFRITDTVLYSARGPDWLYGDGSEIRQGAVGSLPRMPRSLFVYAPAGSDLLGWLAAAAETLRDYQVAVNIATDAPTPTRPFVFLVPSDAENLANPETTLGGDVFVAVITNYRVRLHPGFDPALTNTDYAMSQVNRDDGGTEYINDEGEPEEGDEVGWTVYPSKAAEDIAIRAIMLPRFRSFHTAFYQINAEQDPGDNSSDIIPDSAISALFGDDSSLSRNLVPDLTSALALILADADAFFS